MPDDAITFEEATSQEPDALSWETAHGRRLRQELSVVRKESEVLNAPTPSPVTTFQGTSEVTLMPPGEEYRQFRLPRAGAPGISPVTTFQGPSEVNLMPEPQARTTGEIMQNAAFSGIEGVVNPITPPLILGTVAAPEVVLPIFTAQMAKSGGAKLAEGLVDLQQGRHAEGVEKLGEAGTELGFAGAPGLHPTVLIRPTPGSFAERAGEFVGRRLMAPNKFERSLDALSRKPTVAKPKPVPPIMPRLPRGQQVVAQEPMAGEYRVLEDSTRTEIESAEAQANSEIAAAWESMTLAERDNALRGRGIPARFGGRAPDIAETRVPPVPAPPPATETPAPAIPVVAPTTPTVHGAPAEQKQPEPDPFEVLRQKRERGEPITAADIDAALRGTTEPPAEPISEPKPPFRPQPSPPAVPPRLPGRPVPGEVTKPAEPSVKDIALEELKARGWNTDWPFVPADLMNRDFVEGIRNDPSINAAEKAKIISFAPGGSREIKLTAEDIPLPPEKQAFAQPTAVPATKLFVRSGNELREVTPEQASLAMQRIREESGRGASTLGPMDLYDSNGKKIGHVSYNGRVWLGDKVIAEAAKPEKAVPATKPAPAKEPWQMSREEMGQRARDEAAASKALPESPPDLYATLKALSNRNSRRPYNPELLTPERMGLLGDEGLITGSPTRAKITQDGFSKLNEWERMNREREMKLGDLSDELVDKAMDEHKASVAKAVREGRPVSPEILSDYPDLAKPAPEPPATAGTTAVEGTKAQLIEELIGKKPEPGVERVQARVQWDKDYARYNKLTRPELQDRVIGMREQQRVEQDISAQYEAIAPEIRQLAEAAGNRWRTVLKARAEQEGVRFTPPMATPRGGAVYTLARAIAEKRTRQTPPSGPSPSPFFPRRSEAQGLGEQATMPTVEDVRRQRSMAEHGTPTPPEGPGAATSAEFGAEKPFTTGAANAVTAEKRATLGLPKAREEAARTWGSVWNEVLEEVANNPGRGQELIAELKTKPRPITDREVALLDHEMIGLEDRKNKIVRQMLDAAETEGDVAIPEYRAQLDLIRDQLQDAYDATKVAGREQARAFNIRKAIVDENYSLVKMEQLKRAEVDGRRLTQAELDEVKAMHDKITEAETKYNEYVKEAEEKIRKLEVQHATDELKIAAAREAKADAATGTTRDLGAEREGIIEGLGERSTEAIGDLRPWIRKLALNFIRSGVEGRDAVVNAVHNVLKDIFPNIEIRDTADAISGYGDFRRLDMEAAKVKLRDYSGQLQNVSKLEDLLARRALRKTGPERKAVSDEERRLIKLVNEYKRRYGVVVTDPATQLKSALAAVKTRLTNQIKDLEFQIGTGKKIIKGNTKVAYDAEAQALQLRRDALKEQFDAIFGKPELNDAQRVAMATKALERSITELQRRIDAGKTRAGKPISKTPVTPELTSLREQQAALRDQLQELRDSDTALAEERAVASLQNTIADLERRIAEGDLFAERQAQTEATAITGPLREQKAALQQQLVEARAASPEGMRRAHEQRIDALEKAIAENERRLREGDLSRPATRTRSPEEQALVSRNAELSKQLAELRRLSPEGIARAETQRMAAIEKEIADLEGRITRGELDIAKKPVRILSEAEKGRREVLAQTREILRESRDRAGVFDASRIANAEKALDKAIAETMRQINEGDIGPRDKPARLTSPEIEAKRAELEDLRKIRQELRNAATPKKTREEIALNTLKTRLRNQSLDYNMRLARGDFNVPVRKPVALDAQALRLQRLRDYNRARFEESLAKDRFNKLTTPRKVWERTKQGLDLSRSLITSFDLSAVLRQGKFIVAGHPIRAAKGIPEMIASFASKDKAYTAQKQIENRHNYPRYKQSGLFLAEDVAEGGTRLSRQEEAYMMQNNMLEKIPVAGRLAAGSQRAYTTFLNRLRADSFDAMAESLSRHRPITDTEATAISNFINAATGRGDLHKGAVALNRIFFSPRYVASRFQLLAGQPLYRGTARTRALIAEEYAKTLIGYAVFYTLAKMALPDSEIEIDPRSSDAGKIRIGNTRLDPLAGLQQVTVLMSRLHTGETKNLNGRILPIRGEGVPYKGTTVPDVLLRFLRSKLAPLPGAVVNAYTGKNIVGEPVTPLNTVTGLTVPLAWQDVYKAMQDQGLTRGAALALLSILGEGVQVYDER